MRRPFLAVVALALLAQLALASPALGAAAQVQQTTFGDTISAGDLDVPVQLPGSVTAGNVLVVAVFVDWVTDVSSVTDTLGTTFALVGDTALSDLANVLVYTGTLSASGSDQITIHFADTCFTCETGTGGYVIEVAGVSANATTATASDQGGSKAISTAPTSFQSGSFLAAFGYSYGFRSTCELTAGSGFTALPSAGTAVFGETAVSGVSSPTTFPGTLAGEFCAPAVWVEIGLVLSPTQQPSGIGAWRGDQARTEALLPQSLGSYAVETFAYAKGVFDASKCGRPKGDAVNCLAGQLLAAKLNVADGLDGACVDDTIADAVALLTGIGYHGPSTYQLSKADRRTVVGLQAELETFNRLGCAG